MARNCVVHGVFTEIFTVGVLITGDSGSGKSELALELITRGHQLIADDAPTMTLTRANVVDGSCPDVLRDCLAVHDLGVLNVRAMFGDGAIKPNQTLQLIVHLQKTDTESVAPTNVSQLRSTSDQREILGVPIPKITLSATPGRNLAVIVEAAVRNYRLKLNGFDAANEFVNRQSKTIKDHSL